MRIRDDHKIESIYKEALTMIVQKGFDGFSMQKLAKAAGISPATIYIYFKDKDDLLLQLHKKVTDKYLHQVLQNFDPTMDFATGLAVLWKNRAHYLIQYPDIAHFMENFTFTPLWSQAMTLRNQKFSETMKQFVNRAIQNKELIPMPLEVYFSVAFAPLYNLIRYHKAGMSHMGEKFVLTEAMLMQTLSLVLKALKPA